MAVLVVTTELGDLNGRSFRIAVGVLLVVVLPTPPFPLAIPITVVFFLIGSCFMLITVKVGFLLDFLVYRSIGHDGGIRCHAFFRSGNMVVKVLYQALCYVIS